jgi:hypothetical protein
MAFDYVTSGDPNGLMQPPSSPSTAYDQTNDVLYCSIRPNATTPARWSPINGFTGTNPQTGNYTAKASDSGKLIAFNIGATPATLTLPGTPPSTTWSTFVQNTGSASLTVARNGLLINGAASNLTVSAGTGILVYTDGTNYYAIIGGTSGGSGTVTSVSGTANQISVANGTTTPVISLDSNLILPAAATATTQSAGDSTTAIATDQFVQTATGGLLTATFTVTPTQLKALVNLSSPDSRLDIISAPGAGKMIVVDSIIANFQYSGTPYLTGTGAIGVYYHVAGNLQLLLTTLVTSAELTGVLSTVIKQAVSMNGGTTGGDLPSSSNASLALALASGNSYTAGNSPIAITIYYRIFSVL